MADLILVFVFLKLLCDRGLPLFLALLPLWTLSQFSSLSLLSPDNIDVPKFWPFHLCILHALSSACSLRCCGFGLQLCAESQLYVPSPGKSGSRLKIPHCPLTFPVGLSQGTSHSAHMPSGPFTVSVLFPSFPVVLLLPASTCRELEVLEFPYWPRLRLAPDLKS